MRDMNEKFFVEILSKMIALDDIEDSVKNNREALVFGTLQGLIEKSLKDIIVEGPTVSVKRGKTQ